VLRILFAGPSHGFAIARRIQVVSKEVLRAEEGSLYPALHKMELEGWIESEWGTTENNRQAKYYRLTASAGSNSSGKPNDGHPSPAPFPPF